MTLREWIELLTLIGVVLGVAVTIYTNMGTVKTLALDNKIQIALGRFEKSLVDELRKLFVDRATNDLVLEGIKKDLEHQNHRITRNSDLITAILKAQSSVQHVLHVDRPNI